MDIKRARMKYYMQKKNAARRGIEWKLTFDLWLAWWGPDLDRRGVGVDQLQMQRIGDVGPYSLENIRKGTPKDNGHTRSKSIRNSRYGKPAEIKRLVVEELPEGMGEDEAWIYENVGYGAVRKSIW